MNKDKELDDLFKKGLEDPVNPAGYREADWGALEGMLNQHSKKRGVIYWLPVLSGVAALLLVFVGWWLFRPKTNTTDGNAPKNLAHVAAPHQKANTGTSGGPTVQPIEPQKIAHAASGTENNIANNGGSMAHRSYTLSAPGARRGTTGPVVSGIKGTDTVVTANRYNEQLAAVSGGIKFGVAPISAQPVYATNIPAPMPVADVVNNNAVSKPNKPKLKGQQAFRPQFAIGVLAAPDLNGVGSFQQGKVGTNIGLQFSVGLTRKLTITTGALYSVKPYLTNFSDYHTAYQFSTNPVNVTADCRMIDIPLNLGYQVYKRGQNKISLGTGLSSYLMLHENYTFNYADANTSGYSSSSSPASYTVLHSKKYFFGVVNLNATYEHQINSKVGISVQPFLKLPLTDIGYSQVKLQSTGVAVGVSWNLNAVRR